MKGGVFKVLRTRLMILLNVLDMDAIVENKSHLINAFFCFFVVYKILFRKFSCFGVCIAAWSSVSPCYLYRGILILETSSVVCTFKCLTYLKIFSVSANIFSSLATIKSCKVSEMKLGSNIKYDAAGESRPIIRLRVSMRFHGSFHNIGTISAFILNNH